VNGEQGIWAEKTPQAVPTVLVGPPKWCYMSEHESESVPSMIPKMLHSFGQPFDATTSAFIKLGFGHDFSQLQVYLETDVVIAVMMT
jgi:hypothetical protein